MLLKRFLSLTALFGAVVAAAATPVTGAICVGFSAITNNSTTDTHIGQAQLHATISEQGDTQVKFEFLNNGPEASSICDIYFDDGSLLGIAWIDNSCSGVSFSREAKPPGLPGAENIDPPFDTTAGFSANSDSPPQQNGVNPGELLGIVFSLQANRTFADVLSELQSGDLRIGIHVQAFGDGNSESFVNTPIPEPSALAVRSLLAIMVVITGIRRRGVKMGWRSGGTEIAAVCRWLGDNLYG